MAIVMYYPHYCFVFSSSRGFDSNRNPIATEEKKSERMLCRLEENLPTSSIFTPDGQKVTDLSGVIYLPSSELNDIKLKIGDAIEVYSQDSSLVCRGIIKSFKTDLFHSRIWL